MGNSCAGHERIRSKEDWLEHKGWHSWCEAQMLKNEAGHHLTVMLVGGYAYYTVGVVAGQQVNR